MRKVFDPTGETFGALSAARAWCKENGFSAGPLCGHDPVALMQGDYSIAKWRNLTPVERAQSDGTMTSDDWREGAVTVEVKGESGAPSPRATTARESDRNRLVRLARERLAVAIETEDADAAEAARAALAGLGVDEAGDDLQPASVKP